MELFVQGEGIRGVELVVLEDKASIRDLVKAVKGKGFPEDAEVVTLFIEGVDDSEHEAHVGSDRLLSHCGIGHHQHVHIHRKRRVEVTVHHGAQTAEKIFLPSTTISQVLAWAVRVPAFHIDPAQAADHKLQLCDSEAFPESDVHIGALATETHRGKNDRFPGCSKGKENHSVALCFNLIVKHRHQG